METLLDYLPEAVLSLDHQAEDAIQARFDTIADFYQARAQFMRGNKSEGAAVYRPLPPDALYLGRTELEKRLADRTVVAFSPFADTGSEIDAGGRRGQDFVEARARPEVNLYEAVRERIAAEQARGRQVVIAAVSAGTRDRLEHVLGDHGLARRQAVADWAQAEALPAETTGFAVLGLENGFTADDLAVIAEQDILGDRMSRPARKRAKADRFLTELASFAEGDFVVHVDHGVGRYEGLETLDVGGAPHDCLKVVYEGNDKLYVPVENIEVLSRYSAEDTPVQLDRLGGAQWQARKARVKQRLRDIAAQLMRTAAARALRSTDPISPPAGLYDEFCARFPYAETDDQTKAIEEVLGDLASGRPMDRLVCGDVGFGKTEVALRAAFVVAMSGRQVAVITPTTLLCRQHFATFTRRFEGLPLRVRQLSRLVSAKDAAETKKEIAAGRVDIVIGTHALLGKGVQFDNLGLVIVDEEQHFGVTQKEKLKGIGADIHVLTLTATPIPRTLQLALSGVREMSLIATPPVDRLAVRTFVLPYDPVVVREAIMREHYRGGQVFYVCPRIEDMARLTERIGKLVPEIKMVAAHGQMAPTQLEKAMTAFYDRQYDLLLSTNIIESGLDIPTANTMIVHRAEMFGLAQLYQLRGRIGRSKLRGYAYLTLPPERKLSPTSQEAPRGDADPRSAGRRLLARQPRPRHPRRRQSPGRRAIGTYPRGRHRALSADARRCGGRSPRPGSDGAGRCLDTADQPRHAGAHSGILCRRSARAPCALPAHRHAAGPAGDRCLRRRDDRPLRAAARRRSRTCSRSWRSSASVAPPMSTRWRRGRRARWSACATAASPSRNGSSAISPAKATRRRCAPTSASSSASPGATPPSGSRGSRS